MNHLRFPSILSPFSNITTRKEGDDDESAKTFYFILFFYLLRLQDRIQNKRLEIKEIACRQPCVVLVDQEDREDRPS